ncbi:MAG TPA: thioesterase family protein [Bryobacteraceae bacterium]|nr:thioesterase family protein [Bryobacteraceae bacterium]
MANIPIGTKGESSLIVTPETAVSFLGVDSARVLGTPFLIFHLEMTSRNSVKPFLDEGFDTVGARVDVRHLAATPLGMRVTFRSELTGIEDRRLFFRVEAFDEKDKISDGKHERAIIQVAKFAARVQAKGQRE